MAPITCCIARITPPPGPKIEGSWKTPKRNQFFNMFDKDRGSKSIRQICREVKIDKHTSQRQKEQQEQIGSQVLRTTRSVSKKLGQPLKITKKTY